MDLACVDRVWDAEVTSSVFLPPAFGSRSYAPPRRAGVSPSRPARDLLYILEPPSCNLPYLHIPVSLNLRFIHENVVPRSLGSTFGFRQPREGRNGNARVRPSILRVDVGILTTLQA